VREDSFGATIEAWEAALHPDDRESCKEAIRAALDDNRPLDIEVRVVWPSGEVRTVKAHGRVLRDGSGKAIRMTGISYDITERKRAFAELQRAREDAEAATRAKSEFLANVSHEMRTPLNGILGLSNLALAANPNIKQRSYLNNILASGHVLLDVINQVLDLSKMEAARFEICHAPFALDHVLADVAGAVGLAAEEKGIALQFRTAPNVPLALVGDAGRVRQVLMNLVSNAVKFTERGQVEVSVGLRAHSKSGVTLAFVVKDTGIGMNDAQVSRLFQPFAQADGSVTRKYGGTGLGLAIAKKLVQLMGGKIAVQSVPAQGSTFSFILDFTLQAGGAVPAPPEQLRVLVLDENHESRDYLSAVLSNRNLAVESTASSVGAMALLAGSGLRFDAILVRAERPDLSGLEVARSLRDALPATNRPPILLVANQVKDGFYEATEAAGLAGVIREPFRVSELIDSILQAVGRKPASAAPTQSETTFAGIRVLVVEDVEINRQIAQELLEMVGATVEMASNGREAIERLAKESPPIDVVLMDVQMPVMDGVTAAREIRAIHGLKIPIIAMTAHALEAERIRCLEAGMNDHLAKPVEPKELVASLSKWTNRRPRIVEPKLPASRAPDLPGFDWEAALRRWNNNEPRLRGALKRFADGYAEAADKVREALATGNQALASDLLHELKGVAGILGATAVQHAAEALEVEVRAGQGAPGSALVMTLSRVLERMVQGISELAPLEKNMRSTSELALPLIELVRGLGEIDELLAQNKIAARQRFAGIKNALAAIQPTLAEQLEQDIMRLAYKSARQIVGSLIVQLKQPM
jgi:signal transduction histidine kinase/CheY-like chemotaxis protein